MRARVLVLIVLLFSAMADAQTTKADKPFTLPAGVTAQDFRPGVIIFKIRKEAISATAKTQSVAAAVSTMKLQGVTVVSVSKRFKDDAATASKTSASVAKAMTDSGLDRIYELDYTGGTSIVTLINQLLARGDIEYAEPDYVYHHYYTPNDPQYTGSAQAYLDQVKAPQAWDLNRNASGVLIGIVDSGSELTHEDLAADIYFNTKDPVNGIDDDHDGYVDNYYGWDLVGLSGAAIKEDNDPNVKSDTTEHGVHVSGLASAVSDNAKGIASIAFNAKLLIVKCGADNNGSLIYRGYDGIKYAADHGAQIINCSWGGSGGGSYGLDIINYVVAKGCLVVAAAGNESSGQPSYPAAYTGVLGVAAVSAADIKASYSNYGSYVGISAPGNTILSTLPGNKYGYLSGTSMATPIVSSAAALLKSAAPSLTMEQVGERLRATSDNIDAKNPNYSGLIGKGRLNIYRAISETPTIVKYTGFTIPDNGNSSLAAGQNFDVYLDVKNILAPVTGLAVHLSSTSTAVTINTADVTVGDLASGQGKTMTGPFNVTVKNGTKDNVTVVFKIDFTGNGGAYKSSDTFSVIVNLDYLNETVNQVYTTFTSNGRVGFRSASATDGLGFIYKGENLLYEAAFMIGDSPSRVSDNARAVTGANEHFVKVVRAARITPSAADFEATSEFNDSNNPNRLQVYVKHRMTAFATAPNDKYVIVEYEIFNQGAATLNNLYAGLLTDFDIGTGSTNITKYDALNRIAYISEKSGTGLYAGVKLLTTTAAPAYYPMSYMVSGDPTYDNIFSTAEKYASLASGIKSTGLGENTAGGLDVMFASGYGPFSLAPNGSVKVAFAFIGGDNLADIEASAAAAQTQYEKLVPGVNPEKFVLYQNYPNPVDPVRGTTTISYVLPKNGKVELSLYNLAGQKMRTYLDEEVSAGTHSFVMSSVDLPNGVYIYRMRYNREAQSIKLLVEH